MKPILVSTLAALLIPAARGEVRSNIEYGRADGTPLLLDAHLPDGPGPFPVVILVHGGGWTRGNKAVLPDPAQSCDVAPLFEPLRASGYVCLSIDYRLAPAHPWPACRDDVCTAIRWARARAAEFNGDPARIGIIGYSAGGQLAMFATILTKDDAPVRAAVGLAPQTDFVQELPMRGNVAGTAQQALFGIPGEITPESLEVLRINSPVSHIVPGLPPVLIIQGDADKSVPLRQSENFHERLLAAGGRSELRVIPGAPHRLTEWRKFTPDYLPGLLGWLGENLAGTTAVASPWQSDLGDGTCKNPVLHADYSDPDVVRVGDDYWMTSSSFNHVPGLPILHSRDLVNWTLVNHALPVLVPAGHFAQPRHGAGVWAPAIRYHKGKFWIFYPDPDFGIYVITADDPRGRWSAPLLIKAGKGLIDPCPFWDDNGQAYLIHGWAKSRAGINNLLTLHRMAPDGSTVLDEGSVIIDANKMPGWTTLEGPKLYKRDGWYYVFAPVGGVAKGYQAVFRSRDIFGPYESRVVLDQGGTPVNGPHQGAWVDTPKGAHWFLHFQEMPAHGRIVHLQPLRWRDDGWPVIGEDPDDDGKGQPLLVQRKPDLPSQAVAVPAMSDKFDGARPGLQWQWQANPQAGWIVPGAASGCLSLRCIPRPEANTHWMTPNLLMQKFPAPTFVATTALRFEGEKDGDAAGLIVFGYDYAWLGLERQTKGTRLVLRTCKLAQNGGTEETATSLPLNDKATTIQLRVTVSEGAKCRFAWSDDGEKYAVIGEEFQAVSSMWVGAKVGIFATTAPGNASGGGRGDFDWFHLTRE